MSTTTVLLAVLALACGLASLYFEKRQKKLVRENCIEVTATLKGYEPMEGADRRGRPVFAPVLRYEVDGKEYEVRLDEPVAEADQLAEGAPIRLLCGKNDPSECMPADRPRRRRLFF